MQVKDLTYLGYTVLRPVAAAPVGRTFLAATAYYHHRRFGGPRVLPGEIGGSTGADLEFGRQLPSPGLTIGQIADAAHAVGLPPLVYPLRRLDKVNQTAPRIICRYLNSGLPVTVSTQSHAFVLVGYGRTADEVQHRLAVRFLQPMDGPNREDNTTRAVQYCLEHPCWRLSLQTHKYLGIR